MRQNTLGGPTPGLAPAAGQRQQAKAAERQARRATPEGLAEGGT